RLAGPCLRLGRLEARGRRPTTACHYVSTAEPTPPYLSRQSKRPFGYPTGWRSDDEVGVIPAHEPPVGANDQAQGGHVAQRAPGVAVEANPSVRDRDRQALPPLEVGVADSRVHSQVQLRLPVH